VIDDCDLAGMLEEVGIPVVVAGREIRGIVRKNDSALEEAGQAALIGKAVQVTIRASDAEGVEIGDQIDVGDGKDYRVQRNLQDGMLAKLYCEVA